MCVCVCVRACIYISTRIRRTHGRTNGADADAQTYPLSSSETYKRTRACASTYIERRAFGEHCVRIRVPVPRKRPYWPRLQHSSDVREHAHRNNVVKRPPSGCGCTGVVTAVSSEGFVDTPEQERRQGVVRN